VTAVQNYGNYLGMQHAWRSSNRKQTQKAMDLFEEM